ncbi:hypothetical protein CC78DRAFT_614253 [Lojkania enalia]|uniref:Heterokaryon incompatibility domain-containing protein n=1 Tax=Lojkania enalia TaxID=147567 RepID=A0A9P4N5N8_9PLEO|nr:hypothetical protein CC78DRAFT_614253 [Didymosphaeria enalia]
MMSVVTFTACDQFQSPRALANHESGSYTPLDEANDEIRLLTLEPPRHGAPVYCNLEKASLRHHTGEYSSFLRSIDHNRKTSRRAMIEWVRSHPPHPDHPPGEFSNGGNYTPSSNAYRFKWGDFAALSYVWGNDREAGQIVVNGTVMLVTKNLEEILRRLAANNEFRANYKIWIDAICINQKDESERASQVRKMREIYSSAWTVIAWLGESGEWTPIPDAFIFLRLLASLDHRQRDLRRLFDQEWGLLNENCFYMLHEMMKHEYWSRLWIIQEVVMGASCTVLRCGDHLLDWNTFCAAIAVLYHGHNWDVKDYMLAKVHQRGMSTDAVWQTLSLHLVHKDLRQLSRYEHEGGERLGFRRLLEVANSAHCRDVRDKVFALIGMMEPEIANEVVQAYSLDISRLFTTVTKAFITYYNNLEPLRQANPWGQHGAPSWAADWTWRGRLRWSRPETNPTGPSWNPLDSEPRPDTIYNAHSGRSASISFLNDCCLLRCEGFIFDEIAGLGAREHGFFHWAKESTVQSPTWRSSYGDEYATARALYRALIGGRIANGERAQDRHSALMSLPSTFRAARPQFARRGWTWLANRGGYYFKWERWRQAHNGFMLGKRALESYFTDTIPENAEESTFIDVFRGVERMVMERRFMLTKNGCFGWAPDDAYDDTDVNQVRVGDLIAIVFGCSTPLVIRRSAEHFQIVGEAYVEGMMDGAALRLIDDCECEQQFFTFC